MPISRTVVLCLILLSTGVAGCLTSDDRSTTSPRCLVMEGQLPGLYETARSHDWEIGPGRQVLDHDQLPGGIPLQPEGSLDAQGRRLVRFASLPSPAIEVLIEENGTASMSVSAPYGGALVSPSDQVDRDADRRALAEGATPASFDLVWIHRLLELAGLEESPEAKGLLVAYLERVEDARAGQPGPSFQLFLDEGSAAGLAQGLGGLLEDPSPTTGAFRTWSIVSDEKHMGWANTWQPTFVIAEDPFGLPTLLTIRQDDTWVAISPMLDGQDASSRFSEALEGILGDLQPLSESSLPTPTRLQDDSTFCREMGEVHHDPPRRVGCGPGAFFWHQPELVALISELPAWNRTDGPEGPPLARLTHLPGETQDRQLPIGGITLGGWEAGVGMWVEDPSPIDRGATRHTLFALPVAGPHSGPAELIDPTLARWSALRGMDGWGELDEPLLAAVILASDTRVSGLRLHDRGGEVGSRLEEATLGFELIEPQPRTSLPTLRLSEFPEVLNDPQNWSVWPFELGFERNGFDLQLSVHFEHVVSLTHGGLATGLVAMENGSLLAILSRDEENVGPADLQAALSDAGLPPAELEDAHRLPGDLNGASRCNVSPPQG